jgi:glycosyltransferase involved in cell wall biosynthesis
MQPKRLLMISTDRKIFEEGSAVRARQIEYAREWDEVHIVIFETSSALHKRSTEGAETVLSHNCWAYSTRSWSKFMFPFDAMAIGRFLIEKRGITNITCQDASLTAMAGLSLKKQFHLPVEVQVHNDIGSPYFTHTVTNKVRKSLALSYLPKVDQIRVVSNKIKDYLVSSLGIDAAKITVKPIVVDVEAIKRAAILPDADLHKKYPHFEKIVLVASRLEKEKNIILAIRAWAEVVKKQPKAGLIIVGEGSQASMLRSEAARLGLRGPNPTVVFESWASQSTLFSYYKTCDAFLVTSLFEGYGMVLVEASAAGAKIVSTDVGVAKEVGAQIVEWNEKSVAEGITRLLFKDETAHN